MTEDQAAELTEVEEKLTEIDHHIDSLKLAMKDAKKLREEKVSHMRGLIRDSKRPLFQIGHQEPQEDADAHEGSEGRGKGRKRGHGALSGTEAQL